MISLDDQTLEIINKVKSEGFEIYIVGGAVRDLLLGRPTYDWDFTTNATPEQIQNIFPDSYYDNIYGTVGIPSQIPGNKPYEITTYRTEFGYSDSRRPDTISWGNSLNEDLGRRDFTINALALDVSIAHDNSYKTQLVDYYNGEKDLENKIIRTVGSPEDRFNEDALRMMRAVRFASQLHFQIEENTKNAIYNLRDKILIISGERIRDELLKLIISPFAYHGILLFRDVGLMEIILPELNNTFGVEQKSPNRHHLHDVGTHLLLSLKYSNSTDPIVRLATLIHDIGKTQTRKVTQNGVVTFYNHEVVGGKIAKSIANRLKLSNKQKEKLYTLVRYHQFTVDERQTDTAIRRFISKVGKESVSDMLDLRVADRLGGGANETSWRLEEFKKRLVEVQKQPFTVHDLKITGKDIMELCGLKQGPKIGEVLKLLYERVVKKEVPNEKDALFEEVKKLC